MITKQYFGTLDDGRDISTFTLTNEKGMSLRVLEFGGAIVELRVPDRYGRFADIVSGYDSLADYVMADGYFGALIGRVGNRIGNATFKLDGKRYDLYRNDNQNTLHGGKVGFSHRVWDVTPADGEEPKLILRLTAEDGEEGFPGKLDVTVTYTLLKENALSIHYDAVTDKKTILNLTNHAYFNLGGYASGSIMDHVLQINADRYLIVDKDLIPTGEVRKVTGTPFDFREPKTIGRDFDLSNYDLSLGGGYDHCFVFPDGATEEPVLRVEAYDPNSGRYMQLYTDQPCVQLYTGNFMDSEEHPMKGGCPRKAHAAFCLETQKMNDAINHPGFTDITLNPGEKYTHTTVFRFSTK